ncbi:MAG: tRNA glutamyl-Q(34) synthetase GluQRS [Methylomonas sp.]|nr:MAG: tRNA glutamyl-Q(34) synthetase GluQRS [Methylomonas sp.]
MSQPTSSYVGRFAPSPTGPLHLGSLFTALASYLDARSHSGLWLLRIDDLDIPRNVSGARESILRCLERFGLLWDRDVFIQSQQLPKYESALAYLLDKQWLYGCRCSRKSLEKSAIYPGYCRNAQLKIDSSTALRLKTQHVHIEFDDVLNGIIKHQIANQDGDFIVRRRDQIIAYQFAVVVDDFQQGVTHVVRGADLLDSTPKQIYLQQLLGYPTPSYMHLPIVVDQQGAKLSKQTLAAPVNDTNPARTLFLVLQLLQQNPPAELVHVDTQTLLDWAIAHWQPLALKKVRAIPSPIH